MGDRWGAPLPGGIGLMMRDPDDASRLVAEVMRVVADVFSAWERDAP